VGLAVAITATSADARHRHHHRHGYAYDAEGSANDAGFSRYRYSRAGSGLGVLIPRDWRAAPSDPNAEGNRFVSPTGDAWLRFYAVPADKEAFDQYWKSVAFMDGEELRSLRRDRAWVEVSGFKGGRMYFRKAVLACGEREWRHVEYEYPAEAKRAFEVQVERISRAFDRAFTEFCDQTVDGRN
jgi:serine/threonine-protein kinase